MGSIFQSNGLEQNDPLKQKTGNSNDRDITVAHLLAASGYASAPVDQATTVAYSPASNISNYFFKSASDAVTPLKATESVRAAESVSISTSPPLIRSALTANLLSAEPTMIKALIAAEDPNSRNLSQTDKPLPRPVAAAQAEVPVLRMLKETAAVPVATQAADTFVSGSLPTVARQDSPLAVPSNPLKVVETPIQQPSVNGELRPVAVASSTDIRTSPVNGVDARNTGSVRPLESALVVAPMPTQVRNDGTPINTSVPVRNDSPFTVGALPTKVTSDGTPLNTTPTNRDIPIAGAITQTRNDGTPINPGVQVRNDGTPINTTVPVRNDGTPINTTVPVRNDGTVFTTANQIRNDGTPITTTVPVRNDGTPINTTPIRNDSSATVPTSVNPSNQIRFEGTQVTTGNTRPDAQISGLPPTPLSNVRYETSNTIVRDGSPTREVQQPLPTTVPLTSIMSQFSQTSVTVPDTLVRSAPANDRFTKENCGSLPTVTPVTTDRQSPLPSTVVPSSQTDRGSTLPAVQRSDTPSPSTTDIRVSDSSRSASQLPGIVSERPSTSGVPDTASRPSNTADTTTARVSPVISGVDNNARIIVDNARTTVDNNGRVVLDNNVRPGVDTTRPVIDNNGRPVVDNNARPGVDNNARPGVDNNARPGVDTTRPVVDNNGRPVVDNNARPGVDNNARPGVDNNARPGVDTTRPVVDNNGRPVVDNNARPGVDNNARPGVDNNARPGVDNNARPGVDNTRPGVDNTKPGIDNTRPGVENNLRPGVDGNLRPGIDNPKPGDTKPGVDNTRPGVPGDPTRQDGVPRTTQDGRVPDGRTQDTPRTNADGRPLDGTRPGIDGARPGQDGRPQDPQRSGTDARPQDGTRTGLDGRPQDGQKANVEGRPQDGQRTNPEGKVEPNRNINPEGIRTSDQKTTEAPKGELGRSGATEVRTTDGGKVNQDGAAKNLDGSGTRSQEPGRTNDGSNARPAELSGRNQDGIRNAELNVGSKPIDGTQVRNPENAPSSRSENQSGKLDTGRSDSAANRTAPESFPQSSSTRPGEVRAENVANRTGEPRPENAANRTGEPRPENVANRTGELRPENVANRTGEPRPENVANRTGELRPENVANRTGEPRPESVANRTGEPRPENVANRTGEPRPENVANRTGELRPENIANRTGEPRLDNVSNRPGEIKPDSVANKSIENISTRTNEPSKPGEIAGTKPGEIRTDLAANRVNETPIIKNNEAANIRGEIPSNRPTDVVSNKVDGSVKDQISIKQTDSLNNSDASRQPQIAMPSDMVATQKEAAAIRQILNELKQNQNLTSSEVLELPSFKEALRLLDALKPKDGESTTDGKQHFTTSFVEAMRLSDFLKVLEKANELEQKKIHKQQWAARSLSQNQHRVRYLVQQNDTLESIAEKILGDIRFVQLLVTINRAEIIFTYVNGKSVSTVYEGQYLWIPTPNEVSIHRKHYFNANSAAVRGEPLAPEAETPIMVEEYEAPTTVRDFATRLRSVTAPPVGAHGDPLSSPMAVVLYRLRFAGNRNSVNLDEVEETQPEERRRYKVRLGETLQSIAVNDELMKDVNMWVLICRVNDLDTAVDVVGRPRAQLTRGDIINLPNPADVEEFKLLNRLMEIAELSGKKIDIELGRKPAPAKATPHCKVDRQMSIEKLADRCRMILTDNDDTSYSIKLQRDTMEGKWTTVASYESKGGKTLRWTYKIDGTKNCLEVGLPAAVSREMAIEDFQRNWRFYYNRYTAIKTDTLELMDLSEAANR